MSTEENSSTEDVEEDEISVPQFNNPIHIQKNVEEVDAIKEFYDATGQGTQTR